MALARSLGVEVVELDMSIPFTAARARNEGFDRVLNVAPGTDFVQFVDGDCEVVPGWIERGREELARDEGLVAVWGIRRERHPDASVFNELCDVEWQMGGFGETTRFGGDVMIRVKSLREVGGYNPRVIAAEDDEVAARLALAGGRIMRVDHPMTLHDAAIFRVSQWWRRARRCGHGYAQVGALHGDTPLRKFEVERKRVYVWGAGLPAASVALAPVTLGGSLLLSCIYPLRAARIAARARSEGMSLRTSAVWGLSCALSALPEAVGVAEFHVRRILNKAPRIIEYKGPHTP